jgi:hypothetical protein
MNLSELLTKRRSIRKFQAKAVSRDLIEAIIDDCIVAPIALGYPEKIPGIPHRKDPQILRIIE